MVEEEPPFLKDPTQREIRERNFTFDIESPPTGVLAEMLEAGMGKEK